MIFRNMLIPLGGHPPRDSPSRENIPTGFAPLCATTASRRFRFLAGRCQVARSCASARFEANPLKLAWILMRRVRFSLLFLMWNGK
jgi:hypothetical protein